jgi:hypothetical protein
MPLGFRSGSPGATDPSTVDDAIVLAIASTSNAGRPGSSDLGSAASLRDRRLAS